MLDMKRIVLCLWLGALGLIPSFAQTPTDTVRAVLIGMNDLDKFIFTLEDGNGTLRVRLGGKPATIAPGFYALDVRPGDTFPVIFQLQNKPKKENSHPSGWSTGR